MEVSKLIIPSNGEQVTVNIKDATARAAIAEIDGISPSDVTDKDATLSWGTKTEIATIGEQSIHVTLPSNPDTNAVTSVSGKTGVVTLDKSDVGLGNVTNDSQVKRSEMGVANGVATLDANGKVPASQLPSYVDDVIEGYYHEGTFYEEATHTTAITPETGKIYIDLSTNKSYRWGGSTMVEIASGSSENAFYTPTLMSAPTASTVTYTKDGETIGYEVGQFCRVADASADAGYIFYQLYDLQSNGTVAVWQEMGSPLERVRITLQANSLSAPSALRSSATITVTSTKSGVLYNDTVSSNGVTIAKVEPNDTYTVEASSVNGYVAPSSQSFTAEIAGVNNVIVDYTESDLTNATVSAESQTYSGSALTPAPVVTLNGSVVSSSNYDVSYSNNTNAGTATVTVTGKGDYSGTASGTFTISKAAATYTSPAAQTLTYTGSAQNLLSAGSTNHGTIQYSSDGSTWSTTIPQGTNAGSYTAYWKLVGDNNHNNVDAQQLSISIAKANRTISFTTSPSTVTVGSTITVAASPSAGSGDGTITYSSSNTSKATISGSTVTGVAEGTTTITATISAGTNYNSATTSYSLSVQPAGTTYSLVVTDNQSGASNAATNANITVKYVKDNVETILGTSFKNGNTFLIPNGATNITVTGSSITNFAADATVSGTTYTVTYKACKVTVTISGSGGTVILTNSTKGTTINSGTSSFNGYIAWGDSWKVTAGATTSKYPTISTESGTANSASASTTVTYTSYTLVTSGEADLGLPSGKLWAAANVGASNYYSEGNYFSWGNTVGHAKNSGYNFNQTTYNSTTGASLKADFTSGDATYDAARVNMGGTWRTPTSNEFNELLNSSYTTWVWYTLNGVNGMLVVSKTNSNAIFLPAAGYYDGTSLSNSGTGGRYWSTKYNSSTGAYSLGFYSSYKYMNYYYRNCGRSIRAIKDPEAVDLGSGVKWATGNLTKDSSGNYSIAAPTDYGAYFSWGNTDGHRVAGQTDSYSFDSTTYNSTTGHNLTADFTSGSTTYDAARVRLGSPWRIPTYDELSWLKDNCTWTWKASGNTDYNGVAGYEVVGTNSNKIFLPAAGYYDGTSLGSSGTRGYYWSTKYYSSTNAYYLDFDSSNESVYDNYRYYGQSIRPVQ